MAKNMLKFKRRKRFRRRKARRTFRRRKASSLDQLRTKLHLVIDLNNVAALGYAHAVINWTGSANATNGNTYHIGDIAEHASHLTRWRYFKITYLKMEFIPNNINNATVQAGGTQYGNEAIHWASDRVINFVSQDANLTQLSTLNDYKMSLPTAQKSVKRVSIKKYLRRQYPGLVGWVSTQIGFGDTMHTGVRVPTVNGPNGQQMGKLHLTWWVKYKNYYQAA